MSFKQSLQNLLKANTLKLSPVSGGDINDAFRIDADSEKYFLKYNNVGWAHDMFEAEMRGLILLDQAGVRTPQPIGLVHDSNQSGLVLHWVNRGAKSADSWEWFGYDLAKLHQTVNEQFGLDHDNYIGKLPQSNKVNSDWIEFYASQRIEPQLKMAIDNGLMNRKSIQSAERAFNFFRADLPELSPALIHGDLWNGNLLFDQEGKPVFIDPAVYYGHREMDIAMMKLFGGFEEGLIYYNEVLPLQDGWMERLQFYQLYYILVHVNLFGGSYAGSASRILNYYGDRS